MLTTSKAHYTPDVYTEINGLKGLAQSEDQDTALKEVAKQFESIFINIMLKNMRQANAAFEEGSLFNSNESHMYRDMYDNQLSLSLAKGKGIGLADTLYRQLKGEYSDESTEKQADKKVAPAQAAFRYAPTSGMPTSVMPSASEPSTNPRKFDITVRPIEPSVSKAENPRDSVFDLPAQFVQKVKPLIDKAAEALGFHPLAVLAQAALETGWGKHMVSAPDGQNSHNLFNIKADNRWAGDKMDVTTTEYKAGAPLKERASFRSYDSFEDSIQDYISFLNDNPRYQSALSVKSEPSNYVKALQDAGYATDPKYAEKVMRVMDKIKSMDEVEFLDSTDLKERSAE